MKNKISQVLEDMGLPMNNKGFKYIRDAIVVINEDESYIYNTCKLYDKVAAEDDSTATRVERNIRSAFDSIMTKGNLDIVNKYFPVGIKQTNGNLLATLYCKLKGEQK